MIIKQDEHKRPCGVLPGKKLQCVDADFGLALGRVYVVAKIGWSVGIYHNRAVEEWGVSFEELINPGHKNGLFCLRRFRPLTSTRKTDISIFQALLDLQLVTDGNF